VSFAKGTKARKARERVVKALKKKRGVKNPYAVATAVVKRMKFDPWEDRRFVMRFPAHVEVLYMTREDIEKQAKAGQIPREEYEKYWAKVDAKHLEEVAVRLSPSDWSRLKSWVATWRHEGGSWYLPQRGGYAVRCGGANQHRDPLNVFFLEE
jgi:hypothetical protein